MKFNQMIYEVIKLNLNRKQLIATILIAVFLLNIPSVSSPYFINDNSDNSHQFDELVEDHHDEKLVSEYESDPTIDKIADTHSKSSSRGAMRNSDDNQIPNGKVWKESFESLDQFDYYDNVNLLDKAIILKDEEVLIFSENFSESELSTSRWNVVEGSGTVLTASGILIALKQDWAQSSATYIESISKWQVPRRLDFEWNSIIEGGLEGYSHEIEVYKGPSKSERIWITIGGDKRVKLNSGNNPEVLGPPYFLSENTWYKLSCKVTSRTASLTIWNSNDDIVNSQNLTHNYKKSGGIKFLFADTSNQKGSFDIRVDNVELYTGYKKEGSVISKTISPVENFILDRVIIGKTEEQGTTSIALDILDAQTDEPIMGYSDITEDNYNLKDFNITQHPYIKLRARLTGDSIETPELHWWAITWYKINSWYDDFLYEDRLYILNYIQLSDSELELKSGAQRGFAVSVAIEIPQDNYWSLLAISKYKPDNSSYILITIVDTATGEPIENFTDLYGDQIQLNELDPIKYPSIRIRADFYRYSSKGPKLLAWSLNWTKNNPPEIIEFLGPSMMYRGDIETFTIYVNDREESTDRLEVSIYYRLSAGSIEDGTESWQTKYLSSLSYKNGLWQVSFSAPWSAVVGNYDFKIVVEDFYSFTTEREINNVLVVLNSPLPPPEVTLSPSSPLTSYDLECEIKYPKELDPADFTPIYRWYRDSVLVPDINSETLSNNYTRKYELWRCEVTLFDGYIESASGHDEVFIGNSAPLTKGGDAHILIFEDSVDNTGLELEKHFYDADGDSLHYTILPSDYVHISYNDSNNLLQFIPVSNWYGTEVIIVYASDDQTDTSKSFLISVIPQNDAPVITMLGNQVIYNRDIENIRLNAVEGKELKIKISAYDLDGDTLIYSTNRTDGEDDDDASFVKIDEESGFITFKPPEGLLSDYYLNITVTDNNGSVVWTNVIISIQPQKEDKFEQFLLSTNWMAAIIAIIIICILYYGLVIGKSKFKAYMRHRYQKKLTGAGRLFANYPMAIIRSESDVEGRYPDETDKYSAYVSPYRVELYTYQQQSKMNALGEAKEKGQEEI
ncbi:MAG: hypothetical protein JSV49_00990 [Thermoplasmata archaeon]|nr:MAG: hypothetical protein JSV49_00990 [Thermoplasmata archaeon]